MSGSIVLIGAGSTVFTPGLLSDLAVSPVFTDWAVHLVDLDADAAATMAELGHRIARQHRSGLAVHAHTDRREALPGADLVATTIAVGSAAGWRADLDVPLRHGIPQTVGDSVGPGGVLRALRHVPEVVAIARDVADLAPRARLVNYSNPLTTNVRAVVRSTGVPVVGLCHGSMHTRAQLCRELGVDPSAVSATFAGLNHLCWLTDIRAGGVDLYPRVRRLVRDPGGPGGGFGVHGRVSADLLDRFGLYPSPGDRHVAEFFGDYLSVEPGGDLAWDLQDGLDATLRHIGEKSDLWERLRDQAAGTRALDPPGTAGNQEAERLVSIAEALVTGRDQLELAVNVPNGGALRDLPPWAVVEVPAVVGAGGITPVPVGPLPPGIVEVLTARADQQELVVDAALSGSRSTALAALVADPLVPDAATATAVLDDAVLAHAPRLDAFAVAA